MAEITRLALKMGAHVETMYGLSGIGDLIVTCASMHSRKPESGGFSSDREKTMEEAMDEVQMVVEGVYSAKAGRKNWLIATMWKCPFTKEINRVLFEGKKASDAVEDLMLRDKGIEHPNIPWEK